eukprot:10559716-Alexandrium_andersonii.AAC.1
MVACCASAQEGTGRGHSIGGRVTRRPCTSPRKKSNATPSPPDIVGRLHCEDVGRCCASD